VRFNFASYLINVKSRPDRLENAKLRLGAFGINFTYVEAITGAQLLSVGVPLLTRPNMEANWRSIQKTLNLFLESTDDFCLIFEDDVLFLSDFAEFYETLQHLERIEFDVLQFGYLVFNGKNDDGKSNNFKRLQSTLLKSAIGVLDIPNDSRLSSIISKPLELLCIMLNTDLVRERKMIRLQSDCGLSHSLISGFEPGTHGFIITRKFASLLIDYNLPMAMSGDLLLMTLGSTNRFNIFRTGKPLATQDSTEPSVGIHASHTFDISNLFLK
jgi:GR25 family glycosyltransferase involved in LPS biosynthesis